MRSGKYSRNLLLAATIVSLAATMPMNVSYATNPTPTRGANAAYTVTTGDESNYNFKTVEGETISYWLINLTADKFNGQHITFSSSDNGGAAINVTLPNGKTQTLYYAYTKPTSPVNYDVIQMPVKDLGTLPGEGDWNDRPDPKNVYGVTNNASGNTISIENKTYQNNKLTTDTNDRNVERLEYKFLTLNAGTVHNEGTIESITADFINNQVELNISNDNPSVQDKYNWHLRTYVNGGAVFNAAYSSIGDITGDFIGNSVKINQTYEGVEHYADTAVTRGGAIYQEGYASLGNITGDFINNSADSQGGAIYSYRGTIGNIVGNAMGNSATEGGFIYNKGANSNNKDAIIGDITGNFANNNANSCGGVIYNQHGKIGNITGDFINNNANSGGGAIYNDEAEIKDITGDFISNTNAIYNNQAQIGKINGNFIGNTGDDGAAIEIYGGYSNIESITGKFIGNHFEGTGSSEGGALKNYNGKIGNINADFTDNYIKVTGSLDNALGGAFYDYGGTLGDISGNFTGNYVDGSAYQNESYGGAIYSQNSRIGTKVDDEYTGTAISGNFKDNRATTGGGAIAFNYGIIGDIAANFDNNRVINEEDFHSGDYNVQGGALYAENVSIKSLTGNFTNNSAKAISGAAYGGAIYNKGATIGDIKGNFTNNSVEANAYYPGGGTYSNAYALGGAIYSNSDITIVDSSFTNNSAVSKNAYDDIVNYSFGGAIYTNANLVINAIDSAVNFEGNIAFRGSAIFGNNNSKSITLNALNKDITFTNNNYAGLPGVDGYGIYTNGVLNLNASDGNIIINDKIYANNDINVNDGTTGNVKFANSISGVTNLKGGTLEVANTVSNNINLYGGTIKFTESALTTNTQTPNFRLVLQGESTLDLQNSTADDIVTISNLSGDGELKFNADYDASANTMDKLTVNGGSGIITLNAVNVLNDDTEYPEEGRSVTYLDGTARDNVEVITSAINSTTVTSDGKVYVFMPDLTTNGVLSVTRGVNYNGTLIDAIQDRIGTTHPTAFSMKSDFTASENFGALNTDNREEFTLFGNNHIVSGDNTYTGIEVANGQTLNIDNVTFSNVKDYDIQNEGTLNLSGSNIINTITDAATPTGITNITGGTTTITSGGSITQSEINLEGGRLVINNGANIAADIVGNEDYSVTTTTSNITSVWGGALQNHDGYYGNVKSITGTFKGNSLNSAYTGSGNVQVAGGAISTSGQLEEGINATFINNQATSITGQAFGGALYVSDAATIPSVSGTFTNNKAISTNSSASGGAIAAHGNISSGITGTFTSNSAISECSSASGGAISDGRNNTITNSTFTSNSVNAIANAKGGAVLANGNIDNSTFTSNSATGLNGLAQGGAVYADGPLTISNSTFTGNTVTGATPQGSAVYISGSYNSSADTYTENDIIDSTFTENGAGGVLYVASGHTTVKNSNFTDNLGDAIVFADDNWSYKFIDAHLVKAYQPVKGDIIAEAANVVITGNNGYGIVGNNNHETNSALTLYAKSGDITISENTAGGINNNGFALTLNADTGHNITINDTVSSTTGMTVNDGGTHTGTVALNGALTLGDTLNVNGGTLTLNDTAASSMTNKDLVLNGGALKLDGAAAAAIVNTNLGLNGGKFDIANNVIDDLVFTNAINNAVNSKIAIDVSLGETNTADKITSDVLDTSTISVSDINFISDNKNGGEVQIADGNIKSVIAVSDVAGGYADVQYDNTTGVLSFADKIDWLQQTNGNQSGYRFTKTNNGIMPVNYTSGENNYTFYTDILKKNYTDDSSVAHDFKYTWDNETHQLSVTNSDGSALSTTKSTIVRTGDGSAAAPFVYTGDHVGNTAIGLNRWNNFGTITGDFVGNTNGAIAMGMGVNIPAITGNFIGNSGGRAFSFAGDHSWGSSVTSITGDFIGNSSGAIYIFNWNNGGIGTVTGDFIGNKADNGGAIWLADSHISSVIGNFVNNYAGDVGGALYVGDGKNGANISVTGDFIANQAVNRGGAVYSGKAASTRLIDSSFIGNIAPVGAAIYLDKGELVVTALNKDIEFTNNNSTGMAGGDGYGIYHKSGGYRPFVLNARENRTITVNDKVYSEEKISLNNYYAGDWQPQNGTIIFNNEFTQTGVTEISSNEKNAGGGTVIFNGTTALGDLDVSGTATLKLGTGAGASTFGAVTFSRSPILDIANDSAQTLNVASIKNNAKLNIDLDFTGDSVLADAINITTGGKTGVLTINDINTITSETGAIREFTNLAILTGETNGVTLALSEAIQQDPRFNGDTVEAITYESDYTDNATFANTVFTNTEYSETKQKQLSVVDGTKLSYAETTTVPKHETGNTTTQDVLQTLNQSTNATRTLTTDDATATYTAGADLGVTGAGSLSVTGTTSGENTSTLDMNNKSGFELSNADTVLALSNLNITGIKDVEGGLINITGENSSATLTSVNIAETTNSAIINNGTLSLAGNTIINTGIKGTGSINVDGSVALNGALTYSGDTNVSGGTLKLGAGAATSDLKAATFTNTPTLDLQNSSAQTTTVSSINGNANLNIDIDFTRDDVIADAINITSGGQTGVITLNSIAALNSDDDIREFADLAILTGETSGVTLTLSEAMQADTRFNGEEVESIIRTTSDYTDIASAGQFTNNEFTTTTYAHKSQKLLSVVDGTKLTYTDTETVPEYVKGTPVKQDVLQALNQSTSTTRELNFDYTDDTYVVAAGADMGTTGAGILNVAGYVGVGDTKPTLDMNGVSGFELANANTVLNLSDVNITGLADEEASLISILNLENTKANLTRVTISQTITKDVINNMGELNFAGNNTINSYIGGTGTTNINDGKTTLTQLVQETVNITSGELEVANITATNGISNDGTLTLTGTANTNAITGTGSTVIAGNVNNTGLITQEITVNENKTLTTAANLIGETVTNGGTVELAGGALGQTITGGNITIASGEVISTAANLNGNITNNSNLLLSGTLDKNIAGDSGITKLNDNMTFADGAGVAGTLNFNGKAITMSGDNTTSEFIVGKINSDGVINIDIDTSGTPVSDVINIATAGSTGTITINSINEIGARGDDFTLNVLQGNTGSLQLALSDTVQSQFNQATQRDLYYVSDAYQANIDFDKTSFDTVEREKVTQKTIGIEDNTKIIYSTHVISDTATGNAIQKDALAFINQNTDTSAVANRSMITSDSNKTYTVQEDLGTSGVGTLLVQGAADKTTKLDMNNHGGFIVANSGTTVTLKDINVDNVQNTEGGLVNITNTDSSATLDGAVVNVKDNPENKANVISSNGTLGVTNSTVNAGVNNNGTMNLNGANQIASAEGSNGTTNVQTGTTTIGSIFQKLINIVTGGKLASNGDVSATNGISNDSDDGLSITNGTLTGNVTGNGSTEFSGNSAIADGSKVNQAVNVTDGTLTTSANGLGGAVTNDSEVDLTGGTLETSITGGNTTISGNVSVDDTNGLIASTVEIEVDGTLTTNANNVTGAINNGGNLDLTGGDIQNTISGSGNTTISGVVTNSTGQNIDNSITVASTGDLTTAADKLGGAVANGGTVQLDGGTLSQTITGGNITIVDDVDTNASNLAGTTTVASSKELELTGGDVNNNISGAGNTKITGAVNNNANISTATKIDGGTLDNTNGQLADVTLTSGSLKSNADNVGAVTNNGTYEITGGTIANGNGISGNGAINITGDVINNAENTTTGAVTVKAGSELKIGATGDVFETASSVTMGDNSTLNLQNGSVVATNINNVVVGADDVLNLALDWGDQIDTTNPTNIAGSLQISSIDLTGTDGSKQAYMVTSTDELKDKISIKEPLDIQGTGASNFVKYNNNSTSANYGQLTAYQNSLFVAVTDTEAGEIATYNMTVDETAGGGELDGTLKVQGNGNSITSAGVVIGSTTIQNAELTLEDANMRNITGDAITVYGGNKGHIVANAHDVAITDNTGNAIKLIANGTNYAEMDIDAGSKTITIDNDIVSDDSHNKVTFKGGNVQFNGKFDPAMGVVDGSTVTRGGQDDGIDWTVTSGTLNYLQDSYLNRTTNTMNLNGGTLNTVNGVVTDFALGGFTLSADSNFYADVDLAAGKMDNFISTPTTYTGGTLHVAGLNLISDATADNTSIPFANSTLAGHVDYTGAQGLTALSPIYKYNVGYDSSNGNFDFTRYGSDRYDGFNPAIMAAPVAAQLGGYLTQLNSYDEAFRNMDMYMLMTASQRQALKNKNKIASLDGGVLYDATLMRQERAEGWLRPFATFEKVPLKNGPKVENIAYGSYMGGESQMYDLGHGWDGMWGAYVGYNGSHQNYDGVSIYQNGGTLGVLGMAYKENFFTGLTLNAGASGVKASAMYGNEDFSMLMAGIASKTGYNWELFNGKFIIQPNMLISYSFVNTFDYRNAVGVKINSDPLHAIQVQPEIKFIGNLKNGWQPYASVAMVWNIMDDTKFKANDVSLPELSVKPYVKYGAGIRKTWGERLTGFFQTYITNGGRNGVGLQAGFTWVFGDKKDKEIGEQRNQKSLNKTSELKKTEIVLNGHKMQ